VDDIAARKARIAAVIERWSGRELEPQYLGFFECFNRQLFFEAHEVLEQSWLRQRNAPNGMFYKGLIQSAGAFVHLQKNRLRPAVALFNLAEKNLSAYQPVHHSLDVSSLLSTLKRWRAEIELCNFSVNPLTHTAPPLLFLAHSDQANPRRIETD
jgi:predicted metal-dependent hydrolase